MHNQLAGVLIEDEFGFSFTYDEIYRLAPNTLAVSLILPKDKPSYKSESMFAFFDGLIPEGWLLDIATDNWKLDPRDRMGLLLACCKDCIGAVSIRPVEELVDARE